MKKRNCRKTNLERDQHERAVKVRKMTDEKLCEYLDQLAEQSEQQEEQKPEVPADQVIRGFLLSLKDKTESGLSVSAPTIRKLEAIAKEKQMI